VRCHLQGRVRAAQLCRELSGHAWRRAEEEQPEAAARAHRRERLDEVDAGDRLAHVAALPARGPNHAHAVWQAQLSRRDHARKLSVLLGAHHELGIHRGNQVRSTFVREAFDPLER